MARVAISPNSKYVAAGTVADTAGYGIVAIVGTAGETVTVNVGDDDSVAQTASAAVIDPKTGSSTLTLPDTGILCYVGDYRYIKVTGAALVLSEPTYPE